MEKENNNTGSPVKKRGRPRKNPPIEEAKPKRGGARPGGGRPKLGNKKRVAVNYYVDPQTKTLMSELSKKGVVVSREIDALIHRLAVVYGLIEDKQ